MRTLVTLTMVACVMAAAPALAEHKTFETAEGTAVQRPAESNLDVQLKLGWNGFRLGGRLFGRDGVAGAWLNGQVGSGGVQLDGRVQREDGRAWNFKVDVEMMDWITRHAWRWLGPSAAQAGE